MEQKKPVFSPEEEKIIRRALKVSDGALWDEFWDSEREELLDWHLDLGSLKGRFVWNSYEEPVPINAYLRRKILQEALLTLWNAGEIELSSSLPFSLERAIEERINDLRSFIELEFTPVRPEKLGDERILVGHLVLKNGAKAPVLLLPEKDAIEIDIGHEYRLGKILLELPPYELNKKEEEGER